MGLSASPKALALYWMQSIVRFVLQGPLSVRRYTDYSTLTYREDFSIDLIQSFTLDDDVKFLMCLVRVEETAVLAGNERLEA